jgi:hypothetical protein
LIGKTLHKFAFIIFLGFQPVAISGSKEYDLLGSSRGGSTIFYFSRKVENEIYFILVGSSIFFGVYCSDISEKTSSSKEFMFYYIYYLINLFYKIKANFAKFIEKE